MTKKLRKGKARAAVKEKVQEKKASGLARIKAKITSKIDKIKASRKPATGETS